MKRFWILLLAVFCLSSCCWFGPSVKDKQALLIYFAGNNTPPNDLSDDGEMDIEDIKESWLPSVTDKDKAVLVFYRFSDCVPTLMRLYKGRNGETVEEIIKTYPDTINASRVATLETVLADAEKAWPADHRSLILWSHGSGFLPEGYYVHPQERTAPGDRIMEAVEDPYARMVKSGNGFKSFGEEGGSEMDIIGLSKVLSARRHEFILFDACLMANVEVAYELRNCCDYLLFSPTEIMADGFPYDKIVQPIFQSKARDALVTIATAYMDYYRAKTGLERSATVSVVETAGLEALAAACKPIFQNHQDRILTLDRSKVQGYFRMNRHYFYDLDDFVQQVASDTEYPQFARALSDAVIFKDNTEYFLGPPSSYSECIVLEHVSGLSSYIPRAEYTVLNTYYKTLAWNKATGLVQ